MKRISFFNWSLMLVVLVSGLVVTGCSEDEEGFSLTKSDVVGFWEVYEATEDGETFDINSGYITINLKSDNNYRVKFFTNTYIGRYVIKGNKVVGTTLDPITEYFTFKSLNGNVATIDYSNSTGDKYIFKAKRTSSTSSEIPSDEPKEEVEFKLDYTFSESGDMTRATGEEVYTEFYDKYIKTKVLTPRNYTLTFTRVGITGSIIEIKSAWDNNDCVRLPEGEYYVNGTSYPIENYTEIGGINDLPSDTVYLEFNETVKITKDMSTLVLNAKYNSFLMLFDTENTSKIELVISNNVVKELSKDSNCYWLFARTKYTYKNGVTSYFTSRITRNDNNAVDVVFGRLPMQFGKYYYFNDMTNSFDIPTMESGN